jgi:ParB family transcriptional regulator, chromosome partitioning protein
MHLTAQLVHIIEDLPGALDRLTGVAGTARFEHVVAQLRSEQISWQGLQAAESQWREKGFTALDERPRWDETRVDLCYLRTADGAEIDEAAVADPAQWAELIEEETAVIDVETGEVVDEATVDWNTEADPEARPGPLGAMGGAEPYR